MLLGGSGRETIQTVDVDATFAMKSALGINNEAVRSQEVRRGVS